MFEISIDEILRAALIFLRVGGILFFLPIFGDSPTPVRVRVLLAGALSITFYNIVPVSWNRQFSFDVIGLGWLVFKELVIGFSIGYIAKVSFDTLLMAASLVGYQMGFGMANLLVPDAEQQLNGFTATHRIIVMLIFLGLGLHHIFLSGMAESFEMIPIGGLSFHPHLGSLVIELTSSLFSIALKLAAPILVALMFTMAALGLIARTVPQLNVFTLSFPASFFIGLFIYLATIPFFPEWMSYHFETYGEYMMEALYSLKPR